jgi:WD40 repeat protein
MTTTTAVAIGPYKGLTFFTEDDAGFFFGRERDRDLIIANLKARRLGLLYGPSGVGKSSLLRAGVAAQLRSVARHDRDAFGTAEFIPVVCSTWRDDPLEAVKERIAEATSEFGGSDVAKSGDLVGVIEKVAGQTGAAILVILDQFEEYFLYHPDEAGPTTFAGQLPAAVNRDRLPAGFLVAMREDALAQLDRFKTEIPSIFDSFRRLEPLGAKAAEEAIRRPLEEYNRLLPPGEQVSIEDALVEAVIDQVKAGRVKLDQTAVGSVDGGGRADAIEAPYLQLVMTKLWTAERDDDSIRLRLATLDRLGGAQTIVRSHLDSTLDSLPAVERETAVHVFHHLVTPSGTKIAHDVQSLVEYTREPEQQVRDLLQRLEQGDTRIVRSVPPPPGADGPPRYEIFHDVLAPAILDWQRRESTRELERERDLAAGEARRQRRRAVFGWSGAAIALAALLAVISVLYVYSRSQSNASESRRLASAAEQNLNSDPELSTLLALAAINKSPTPEAQQALRQAFSNIQEEWSSPSGGSVHSVAMSPNGTEVAATEGTRVKVWNLRHPHRSPIVLHNKFADTIGDFTGVAFSPDGTQLVVGGSALQKFVNNTDYYNSGIEIFDVKTWQLERTLLPAGAPAAELEGFAYSPSGTSIATVNAWGQLCMYTVRGYTSKCAPPVLQDNAFNPLWNVSFNARGTQVAVSAGSIGAIVWSIPTLTMLQTIATTNDVGPVMEAALSPSGEQLAIAGRRNHVAVFDLNTAQPTLVADLATGSGVGDPSAVRMRPVLAFSPNGADLLTGGDQGQTTVWDLSSKVQAVQLNCRCGLVTDAAFDPAGRPVVVTGSEDGRVRVWDALPRQLTLASKPIAGAGTPTHLSLISKSDDVIFESSGNETAVVADVRTGQIAQVPATDVAVSTHSGESMIVTSESGSPGEMWSLQSQEVGPRFVRSLVVSGAAVAAISPSGQQVAFGGVSNQAFVESVQRPSTFYELTGSELLNVGYTTIAYDASGTRIIIACLDGKARMWRTSRLLYSVSGEANYIGAFQDPYSSDLTDAQFSSDGKSVVVSDTFGDAIVFDVATHQIVRTFNAGTNRINSASFNPSGTEVVTAGEDGVTRIWDISTGTELATFGPVDVPSPTPVSSAIFTHDGRDVVTLGSDRIVRIWSTAATLSLTQVEAAAERRVTRGLTPAERSLYQVSG